MKYKLYWLSVDDRYLVDFLERRSLIMGVSVSDR